MDFNFTETVKCEECGEVMDSSDEDHDCTTEYVFTSDDTVRIKAANPMKAWEKLTDQVDNPIPYMYRGPTSCGGEDSHIRVTSAEFTSHTGIWL